jgi:hypothetical protein
MTSLKRKTAFGNILITVGMISIVVSTVAALTGPGRLPVLMILFAGGVIVGLGATIAVRGLYDQRRLN